MLSRRFARGQGTSAARHRRLPRDPAGERRDQPARSPRRSAV